MHDKLDFRCFLESGLVRGKSAGSFPEQQLVIEPNCTTDVSENATSTVLKETLNFKGTILTESRPMSEVFNKN